MYLEDKAQLLLLFGPNDFRSREQVTQKLKAEQNLFVYAYNHIYAYLCEFKARVSRAEKNILFKIIQSGLLLIQSLVNST